MKKPEVDEFQPDEHSSWAPGQRLPDSGLIKLLQRCLTVVKSAMTEEAGCPVEVILIARKQGWNGMVAGAHTDNTESSAQILTLALQALLEPSVFRNLMQGINEQEQRRNERDSKK